MFSLRIHTDNGHLASLEEILFACGACSLSVEDAADNPIFEPPLGDHPIWPNIFLHAFFSKEEALQLAMKALENLLPTQTPIVTKQIEEQDWQAKFQQQFNAKKYGEHLWVYPSWLENPCPEGTSIMLDPGLAFGTGHHPTTDLCLTWLSNHPIRHKTLLDFGCGSGILALAAGKLGAKHVYAIDIDPQAHLATKSNIAINHLDKTLFTVGTINVMKDTSTDVIIANILAKPLIELRDTLSHHLNQNGTLVLSGILSTQIDLIMNSYTSIFENIGIKTAGDWACLVFQPKH
jgi:ribosomal protein L11 methyltransferase